jgi:uncharacterized membrane protein
MRSARLVIGIIGMFILIIIGGGIAAISAYAHGESSVAGALWNLIEGSFLISWILGLISMMVIVIMAFLIYTGLRSKT